MRPGKPRWNTIAYLGGRAAARRALPGRPLEDDTHDTLFGGQVALRQPARGAGYRTNVDAILLAGFAAASASRARVAFDLGAGLGAVALSLLHLGAAERVTLIEIDEAAAALAVANLKANGWAARGEVICDDVASAARARPGAAGLVVCNPPYFEPGRGHLAREPARARARSGPLRAFAVAARTLAGKRARVCFVYPARELGALLDTLRAASLEPKRMRLVRGDASSPARVALVEARLARPGGLIIEPDLVERESGRYTPEVAALLRREGTAFTAR